MKVTVVNTSNLDSVAEIKRYNAINFQRIIDALNGKLSIEDNLNGKFIGVTFSSANANTTIKHNLNRTPTGYISVQQTAAMTLYDGTTKSTTSEITLKSSATGFSKIYIF